MPNSTLVPIRGRLLKWALEEGGLGPGELASSLHVSQDSVQAWIAEAERPNKTQFKAIAQRLHRPTSFFFLPEPPKSGLPPSYRRPPGSGQDRLIRKEEAAALRQAREVQKVSKWIDEGTGRSPVHPPELSGSPELASETASHWLGWSLELQLAGESPSGTLKLFRTQLEERGLLVLHLPMREGACRGFSLTDSDPYLIAINTAYKSAETRLFSYAHELGHVVRRSEAICSVEVDTQLEWWCERFASAFLLPAIALESFLDGRFGTEAMVSSLDDVKRVARHFRVSLRATAVRLERIGRGIDGLYNLVDSSVDYGGGGRGGGTGETRPEKRLRELGVSYAKRLLVAQQEGLLSTRDVLQYANVPEKQFRAFLDLATAGLELV
jgi:Zn-dependent peptidase ImmA (M78 family)